MKTHLRYAVIGGGAAGCVLAWHLTRNRHAVTLYEKEKGLGGLAGAIPFGKTQIDRFYHHIFTSDSVIQSYLQRFGLESHLHWCASSIGFEKHGKLYPFTTPWDLLRFSPLSPVSRLRVGWAVLRMRKRDSYQDLESITAEHFIIQEMGEAAYRTLWEPLLRSKFGERYREVSAVWFWGKVKLRGGTRSKSGAGECLGYLQNGWGQLFDRMGEAISRQGGDIRLHALVNNLSIEGSKVQVRTRDGSEEFDRVIVTPNIPAFIEMAPSLPEAYQTAVRHIPYQGNITMILGLDRSISPYYWLNITDPESPFVALIEHTRLFTDPNYEGQIPIYLSRYLSPEHPFYRMRVPELRELFVTYLEQLFPAFQREWIRSFTFSKVPCAQPVVGLNYSLHKPAFVTPIPGVYLCTMLQIYPEDRGMNYSMKIAEDLLRHLGELDSPVRETDD